MLWLIFAILSALLFTFSNIIDKLVLEKWIKHPIVSSLLFAVFEVLAGVIVYLFHGFKDLSTLDLSLALFSGFLTFLSTIIYFKAASLEEISNVVPFFYLTPIYIMIFGYFFLSEKFSIMQYAGIILLVVGAVIISSSEGMKFRLKKQYLLLILGSVLIAISSVITKNLLDKADFWTIFGYSRIGMVFLLIPLIFFNYKKLKEESKTNRFKIVFVLFSESFTVIALILIFFAYTLSYVTFVNAIISLQALFLFLITYLLSRFFPKILKEDISKKTLIKKSVAIILMVIGSILLL